MNGNGNILYRERSIHQCCGVEYGQTLLQQSRDTIAREQS